MPVGDMGKAFLWLVRFIHVSLCSLPYMSNRRLTVQRLQKSALQLMKSSKLVMLHLYCLRLKASSIVDNGR